MMKRLQTRGLVHHKYDFSEFETVGNLMRSWYENAVVHADISSITKETDSDYPVWPLLLAIDLEGTYLKSYFDLLAILKLTSF